MPKINVLVVWKILRVQRIEEVSTLNKIFSALPYPQYNT